MKKLLLLICAILLSITLALGAGLTLREYSLVRTDEIYKHYYEDGFYGEKGNLPYNIKVEKSLKDWSLVRGEFYDTSELETFGSVEELFRNLTALAYVKDQHNPNLIWSEGGSCQAFAIYVYKTLASLGLEHGFLYTTTHVYNYVLLDGTYFALDISNKRFSECYERERLYILDRINQ